MVVPSETSDANRKYFKYVTRATGRIILQTCKLRWSSPLLFNDPFDNQFDLHSDADAQEAKKLALAKLWETYSGAVDAPIGNEVGLAILLLRTYAGGISKGEFEKFFEPTLKAGIEAGDRTLPGIHEELRKLARKHKILCLSLIANNPLMWAYYAESHKGLVLQFRNAPDLDSPWKFGQRVRYSPSMPRLFDAESLSDILSGRAAFAPEIALQQLVFTKSIEWAHEQEWRVFSGVGRNENDEFEDIPFHPLELDSVILGCRTPADDRDTLAAIVQQSYPHAALLQISPKAKEYGLDLVPLNNPAAA